MSGHGEKLSRKMEGLIVGLLTQSTLTQAAQVAGVSESTARRWLQREEFQECYQKARQEAVSRAVARLQGAANQAVNTLSDVMSDLTAPPAARVGAAKVVLEYARAAAVEELEVRYRELAAVVGKLHEDIRRAHAR